MQATESELVLAFQSSASFSDTHKPARRNATRIWTQIRCATRAIGSARTLPPPWANLERRAERHTIAYAAHGQRDLFASSGTARTRLLGPLHQGKWSAAPECRNRPPLDFLRERSNPPPKFPENDASRLREPHRQWGQQKMSRVLQVRRHPQCAGIHITNRLSKRHQYRSARPPRTPTVRNEYIAFCAPTGRRSLAKPGPSHG
jgi:hypothetical protein